jgi:uncharacterized delta-60 repeat protein
MGSLRAVVLVGVCALAVGGGSAAATPDAAYGPAFTSGTVWSVVVDSQGRAVVSGFDGSAGFVERFTSSGHIDTTFGGVGFVSFPTQIPSIAVDTQNRVLVGGTASGSLTVWRLTENGTLDATFGSGGKTELTLGLFLQRLTLDSAGRIVAVGFRTTDQRVLAVRLGENGGLDAGFGSAGVVDTGLNGQPTDVAVGSDDHVFVGGGSSGKAAVRALLPDGTPDLTFGAAGTASVDVGANAAVTGVAIDAAGAVVIAGQTVPSLAGLPFAARFTATGQLDSSFGVNGLVVPALAAGVGGFFQDVAISADGQIALAGPAFRSTGTGSSGGRLLAVLDSSGHFDPAYMPGGLSVDTSGAAYYTAVAFQADGGLLVGGQFLAPSPTFGFVTRFLALALPVVHVPTSPVVAEATGPLGAAVTFAVSADSAAGDPLAVTCDRPSGSTFPIGDTTVSCTATDVAASVSSATFTVRVVDTTAPVFTLGAATADATDPAGASVVFGVSANDLVDGVVQAQCVPSSGSTFAIGDTQVSCTATDGHGNVGTGGFVVHVRGALEQLTALRAITTDPQLLRKLEDVDVSSGSKVRHQTCLKLEQYARAATRDPGGAVGSDLAGRARRIEAVLAC